MRLYTGFAILAVIFAIRPLMGQEPPVFRLSSECSVHMLLTDARGRSTGCNPCDNPNENIINGIPGSNYSYESVGDDRPSMLLELGSIGKKQLGQYKLMVTGRGLDSFYVASELAGVSRGRFRLREYHVNGLIDQGQVMFFSFELAEPLNKSVNLVKLARTNTLRQELRCAFKLKTLGDSIFYRELDHLVQLADAHYVSQHIGEARRALRSLQAHLRRAKANPSVSTFVSPFSYAVLLHDVDYVLQIQNR